MRVPSEVGLSEAGLGVDITLTLTHDFLSILHRFPSDMKLI